MTRSSFASYEAVEVYRSVSGVRALLRVADPRSAHALRANPGLNDGIPLGFSED